MKGEPILYLRLVANKRGFETVKPTFGLFNNRTSFVEILVKTIPVDRRLSGRSAGTSQSQLPGLERQRPTAYYRHWETSP